MGHKISRAVASLGLLFSCISLPAYADPGDDPGVGTSEQGLSVPPPTLNGVWNCNDGGLYYLRQIGNEVWWYGQSADGGLGFSNVFHGSTNGRVLSGTWADVPKGQTTGSGSIALSISNGLMVKVSGGGNFGGSKWTK